MLRNKAARLACGLIGVLAFSPADRLSRGGSICDHQSGGGDTEDLTRLTQNVDTVVCPSHTLTEDRTVSGVGGGGSV